MAMSHLLEPVTRDDTVLLVVDVQEKLLSAIHEGKQALAGMVKMVQAARIMDLPIVATEQYPQGLGSTCPAIRDCLESFEPFEKMDFSACVEEVMPHLRSLSRATVCVVGIEAHVCVQQTVFGLLRHGYRVVVCADGVGSRRIIDRDVALSRMAQAGAMVSTVESVIFEMLQRAGTDEFKQVLSVVK